ncbi:WS/DGAT domain-containing protein [Rhodococcus gannanensis]|uniref:WS/DGAT domain-containing protein n=1 Tax=Rhodococcus gannanensis TaxID=1960308 RepID=A0ABW4NZQ6_9NOCA
MPRMTFPDAQSYWISRRIPTDQFLLYCFDAAEPLDRLAASLLVRARQIPDLCLQIREVPFRLDVPWWTPMEPDPSLVVVHDGPRSWEQCRGDVAGLLTDSLDPTESPWRLHLFGPVSEAPEGRGDAVVAVLQVAHALGDGRRTAEIARLLFTDTPLPPSPTVGRWRPALATAVALGEIPVNLARLVLRMRPAYLAHRQRNLDTESGVIPEKPSSRSTLVTNGTPDWRREIRTVVVPSADLRGPGVTVTVGVLTAVSVALSRYAAEAVAEHGAAAEVTVARSGRSAARNHFCNVTVDLHPEIADLRQRALTIAASLRAQRLRADHPSRAVEERATAAVPAPLLRRGIDQFDFTAVPDEVTGNTVVSSVDRGPADLALGGGAVRFTAGFPALSAFMGLTHGVHGIGDRVTISVATSPAVVPDTDRYEEFLRDAVRQVSAANSSSGSP